MGSCHWDHRLPIQKDLELLSSQYKWTTRKIKKPKMLIYIFLSEHVVMITVNENDVHP
jgi:hypothetical protein